MFRVEQRLYALPLNAVAEIARTMEENIRQVERYDVLQLRNDVLPLLRLARNRWAARHRRGARFLCCDQQRERKFGVVVDELAGEGELVIKALDDHSITTDLVSGLRFWAMQGGSHPEHDRPDRSLHRRSGGRERPPDGGLLSSLAPAESSTGPDAAQAGARAEANRESDSRQAGPGAGRR